MVHNEKHDSIAVKCARANIGSTLVENAKWVPAQKNTTVLHENVIENKFPINLSKSYKPNATFRLLWFDCCGIAPLSYHILRRVCFR